MSRYVNKAVEDKQALLDQLHGLKAPTVSAIPAPGWWLLLVALMLLAFGLWQLVKKHRQRQWYRQALQEIQAINRNTDQLDHHALLSRCSVLARQLALVVHPRMDTAATVGEAWLQQLDGICRKPVFTQGPGRLLLDAPYQANPQVQASDVEALSQALKTLADAAKRQQKA